MIINNVFVDKLIAAAWCTYEWAHRVVTVYKRTCCLYKSNQSRLIPLDLQEQSAMTIESKYYKCHSKCTWNYRRQNVGNTTPMPVPYIMSRLLYIAKTLGLISMPNLGQTMSIRTIEWQVPTYIIHYCLTTRASVYVYLHTTHNELVLSTYVVIRYTIACSIVLTKYGYVFGRVISFL